MKAIVVTIGDEILIGQIVDTNSTFISQKLHSVGIETLKSISIKDSKEEILNTLEFVMPQADIVVVTGGLGPTNDDITKKVLSDYFNDTLEYNDDVMKHIEELFTKIGRIPSHLNKEQSLLPKNAQLLNNKYGTAPGMLFEKDGKILVSLPGVPFEMKALVEDELLPIIERRYSTKKLVYKTLLTYGLPESELADKINLWESNLDNDFALAYLPSPARVRLRLSLSGDNAQVLEKRIESEFKKLDDLIGDFVFGYDDDLMEEIILNKLSSKSKTISLAESFTGGKLASMFTSIPGSSKVFKGSVVAYSADAKVNLLSVDRNTIKEYSVVSHEVALEMARNVRVLYGSDYSIATTGVAGPDKGEDGKDLGTAIIAISTSTEDIVEEFNFGQPREKMQGRAIAKALDMLNKML